MDSVVQRVAANAEESASTSEEMNAQAEQLKGMVGDLTGLVGRAAEGRGSRRIAKDKREPHLTKEPAQVSSRPALAAPARKHVKGESKAGQAKERKPEQIIPLDDEDFKDF